MSECLTGPKLQSVRADRCARDYTVSTICKGGAQMDASSSQLVYEWCTFQCGEHAKGRPFMRAPKPMPAHH